MTAVRVCGVDDVAVSSAVKVEVDGIAVSIVKDSAGTIHAIGDTCTHGDISLSEGFVEGDTLECWAHGSAFSLEPVLTQSAWFRPHNRDADIHNLYLVGAGTHPGAGVPGVVGSAKATARLMLEEVGV